MITFKNVSKTFRTKSGEFHALKNVSIDIQENAIHGIIGLSGAGKSTLIRIINQLEKHDQGLVSVFDYKDLRRLNKESTRMFRKDISMIFQRFNLLEYKTVFENIELPISLHRKINKEDIRNIKQLIRLVGLDGYTHSYPSQLSGGQQQRVGIARALVNNPKILLCDEPTSALDTLTIKSILELIQKIKRERNLTVIIVTHDMNVIKSICDNVTVLHHGEVVENDSIDNIIFQPKSEITKQLLDTVGFNLEKIVNKYPCKKHIYVLHFAKNILDESILSIISKQCRANINILYANITPNNHGVMLIEIISTDIDDVNDVLTKLKERGVEIKHVQ